MIFFIYQKIQFLVVLYKSVSVPCYAGLYFYFFLEINKYKKTGNL